MLLTFVRLALLIFICFGCSSGNERAHSRTNQLQNWKTQNGKLKILSTTAMINDLVKEVGSDFVDTIILIQGDLDPHSYQLVKGDDEKLRFADVIFYNGLGLEHGPTQHHLYNDQKAIGLGNELQKQFPQFLLHYNGQLDPHIWMDMSLWAQTIPTIVSTLSSKDPAHAVQYQENGDNLIAKLQQIHHEIKNQLLAIPEEKRYLVTSHDAFNYFTRAYLATEEERELNTWQQRFAAPEGLAPESQLSTSDIQLIIDHVEKYHIHVLFPESNLSKASIQKILSAGKEKGLNLQMASNPLYADALGPPGSSGDTYIKMIQHNGTVLAEWLSHNNDE